MDGIVLDFLRVRGTGHYISNKIITGRERQHVKTVSRDGHMVFHMKASGIPYDVYLDTQNSRTTTAAQYGMAETLTFRCRMFQALLTETPPWNDIW